MCISYKKLLYIRKKLYSIILVCKIAHVTSHLVKPFPQCYKFLTIHKSTVHSLLYIHIWPPTVTGLTTFRVIVVLQGFAELFTFPVQEVAQSIQSKFNPVFICYKFTLYKIKTKFEGGNKYHTKPYSILPFLHIMSVESN